MEDEKNAGPKRHWAHPDFDISPAHPDRSHPNPVVPSAVSVPSSVFPGHAPPEEAEQVDDTMEPSSPCD
jgi:hypothetical protein